MKRWMYRAQLQQGLEHEGLHRMKENHTAAALAAAGLLMTAAGYSWNQQLFIYYECVERDIAPEELLPGMEAYLVDWPGGQAPARKWVPMVDVFHFNAPASFEHWMRKEPVERRVGRVAHLKPDMISSYIYYHYQLQEERAFLGDKYEIIAIHENLLFGYQEFPKVVEEPLLPKKLHTQGTPANWNDSRMDLHFQPWDDGHLYFKPIETVFTYYSGEKRQE
ncbi:hypothetical protein [Paenibacillus hexagrammi]|uniref:Uncharacterized protein n=1 Tax=Paenibacillus hexagrammi TaxID=2908839 RepID=A0ABY3SC69_9BACL|nr:hypothetical protein [Paenibacillus sp. YPD9-1]UJF31538.1 hypothetical protein L0M14_17175 [Paenibacillus sp. YPD9-1]